MKLLCDSDWYETTITETTTDKPKLSTDKPSTTPGPDSLSDDAKIGIGIGVGLACVIGGAVGITLCVV